MKFLKILFSILAGMSVLYGCTAINTMPIAARAGDTITVAVGSPDGMTLANTTASYAPSGGGSVALPIKSIVRLLPDQTSRAVQNPTHSYWELTNSSGHQPWLSVLVIDLPTSGLPVGTGAIHVSTTAEYPTIADHVNNVPINLEILPGTGTPHPLEYNIGLGSTALGNLNNIEPSHGIVTHPTFDPNATWPTYGAIEITLQFAADGAPPSSFQLIPEDISSYTGSQRNVIHKVAGDSLVVSYISPTGLLQYYEPRFTIVPLPARPITGPLPGTMPSAPPVVTQVRHFDINGALVSGPSLANYTVDMF
ncbi:MAG: hypothetical protein R3F42_14560 [Pseudomonadota bacterium]